MGRQERFPRRLTAVPAPAPERLDEARLVIDEYLTPAVAALKQSSEAGDTDAVRAYAYELLALTGSVIAACPRPPRRRDVR